MGLVLGQQVWQEELAAVDDAPEVDVHDPTPVLERNLLDGALDNLDVISILVFGDLAKAIGDVGRRRVNRHHMTPESLRHQQAMESVAASDVEHVVTGTDAK